MNECLCKRLADGTVCEKQSGRGRKYPCACECAGGVSKPVLCYGEYDKGEVKHIYGRTP